MKVQYPSIQSVQTPLKQAGPDREFLTAHYPIAAPHIPAGHLARVLMPLAVPGSLTSLALRDRCPVYKEHVPCPGPIPEP